MPRPAAVPAMSRRLSRGSASGIGLAFRAVRTWGSPRRDARKPSSVGSGSCPRRHGYPLRFASVVGRTRNAGSHVAAACACAGDCMLTVVIPSVSPRAGSGGPMTVKSWLCSSDATAFQLKPSAHAPWTRTMVGFGMSVSPDDVCRARSVRNSLQLASARQGSARPSTVAVRNRRWHPPSDHPVVDRL